ncbi:RNA 2',3'-cyclic phosphodiesterase [Nesterenkonia sp. K-15-9-6]|uniref:RNA 2',3'-cyclic phosphodiesterase n=1 Tax=Nesterenkonia sp. K-15-9-6 TaxID=3093918 RepID=UPI00404505AF
MRLFVSLTPPPEVLDHLDNALESVRALVPLETGHGPPALRWVPEELRHITVAFFGELPAGAVEELHDALGVVMEECPPLELRLRGAGVFSSRTLWAGVQDLAPAAHSRRNGPLTDLMAACERAGRAAGSTVERPERRRAHLTLARARGRAGNGRGRHRGPGADAAEQLHRLAEALAVYEGPPWSVDEAQLMLSELGAGPGGGPRHETLARLPRGG